MTRYEIIIDTGYRTDSDEIRKYLIAYANEKGIGVTFKEKR